MVPSRAKADVLFELSWEVCNKVGGIYTVLMSKTALMKEYYKEYITIGPYIKQTASYAFEPKEPPQAFHNTFEILKSQGIICHYGTWQIKGYPNTILIDFSNILNKSNELKAWCWNNFNIDSLNSGFDFDEPLVFSYACSLLIQSLKTNVFSAQKVISHHHEWMTGLALLFLKQNNIPIKTIFTTHATMLARAIASKDDIYQRLEQIDPQKQAYAIGVQDKFLTEKACAHTADVFTTVSQITSLECEKLLGKKPDVLLLNGLDMGRFPTLEETTLKHIKSKDKIKEFLSYHFYPYYRDFDIENNLLIGIFGRYEFKNKGIDVFIDALGKLNQKLKQEQSKTTITAFIWVPNQTHGVKKELLENKNYYGHIKDYVKMHENDILKKIMHDFITNNQNQNLFTKEFLSNIKRDVMHFTRIGLPPILTHNLSNENTDPTIQKIRQNNLLNHPEDKVKIILYPCYLDGNDSLLNLSYYDALAGLHLAVFPSYYEPWGYTPLEAAAMGVSTITTDVSGFGRFITQSLPKENQGIYILNRFKQNYEQITTSLMHMIHNFSRLDHAKRVQNKINAKQLSHLADWRHLITNYITAHNMALEK